jgi:hypothetical protein
MSSIVILASNGPWEQSAMQAADWKVFQEAITEAALEAATRLMDRNDETFYAIAFHEFYAETGGTIAMPCLAANSEERLAQGKNSRWSSADWKWPQIRYATATTRKLHRQIERDATSQDEAHWGRVHMRFVDSFIRVAKTLQKKLKSHQHAHRDLGAFVFKEDDLLEVLQRCTTPARFQKLFPRLQAERDRQQSLTASPRRRKLETYREDLAGHQEEIVRLGAEALPMLRDALRDEEQAWIAADLLGKIGIADPEAVEALKRRARTGVELAFHDTTALALLGEVDFLLELAGAAKTRGVAVRGICSLYSVCLNWCQQRKLLDYRLLERLLEQPECRSKVKELYSGPCRIDESSVGEALRGLESKSAVIREHAVTVLGDRQLGGKAAERILPALAARLQDRHANVRRLTILALARWKKAARPFAGEIRRLFQDPNGDVAFTARDSVKEVG